MENLLSSIRLLLSRIFARTFRVEFDCRFGGRLFLVGRLEFFAGLALQALVSNPEWSKYIADLADGDINARNALRRKYADYL
jgi:hypothetical protein